MKPSQATADKERIDLVQEALMSYERWVSGGFPEEESKRELEDDARSLLRVLLGREPTAEEVTAAIGE